MRVRSMGWSGAVVVLVCLPLLLSADGTKSVVQSLTTEKRPRQPSLRPTAIPQPTPAWERSDPPILTWYVVQIGSRSTTFEMWADGSVLFKGAQISRTARLPDEELANLITLLEGAQFQNLQTEYFEQDPPGVHVDMDYDHITYEGKKVRLRGTPPGMPIALVSLQRTLRRLRSELIVGLIWR